MVHGQDVVYAGFWKRYAAYFIDYILLTVVTLPLSMIINVMGAGSGNEGVQVALTLVVMLLSMVISIGYYAGFHASRGGATLGKMAVGIKVVRGNGERISFLRAFCRYLATIVSSLILMIGFIMAAFTERKQALHDMMCDTLVVDKWAFTEHPELQQRGLGTVTIVILVIAALAVVALFGVMIAMIGVIASMS
ncbi:RDD family protein [compost metagenome]